MKTCEEKTKSVMDRIKMENQNRQKKKKKAVSVGITALVVCVTAALGFGVYRFAVPKTVWPPKSIEHTVTGTAAKQTEPLFTALSEQTTVRQIEETVSVQQIEETVSVENPVTESVPPTESEPATESVSTTKAPVSTQSENPKKGSDQNAQGGYAYLLWNHLSVGGALKTAFENDPNGVFLITATFRPTTANITSFFYENKSLSQWATAAYEQNASEEAKKGYKLAYNAYLEAVLPAVIDTLNQNNIPAERAPYTQNALILSLTPEQLKNLPLENIQSWYFDLTAENQKGTVQPTSTDEWQAVN